MLLLLLLLLLLLPSCMCGSLLLIFAFAMFLDNLRPPLFALHLGVAGFMAAQEASSEAAATQVGAMVTAKVPYMLHGTVLVPEYPGALHVNVHSAPLATSEEAQELVYALFPAPPAAMLLVHCAGTAQHVAASLVAHAVPAQKVEAAAPIKAPV